MRLDAACTVVNSKDKVFPVSGYVWSDGTFFVRNPRPDKYPQYAGLYGTGESKDLAWVVDKADIQPGPPSKFRIRSIIVVRKKRKTK